MTTYKGTHGTKVQNFSSDPSNPLVGQVWYNTTSDTLKINLGPPGPATWVTQNNMNTARLGLAGAGTVSASLAIGGLTEPPQVFKAFTESYNGTSWTEVADLNLARAKLAASSYSPVTSSIVFAGDAGGPPPSRRTNRSETWNGSAWTDAPTLNTARAELGGAGNSATNALAFGGEGAPGTGFQALTEIWNGSSWTETTDLPQSQAFGAGAGASSTAALSFLAYPTGYTYSWNGSNWTEVNALNVTRYSGGGSGTNTSAVAIGGFPGDYLGKTETWNGTNWTVADDMNVPRYLMGAGGVNNASSLAFGGATPGQVASTEEFKQVGGVVTVTTS